MWRSLILKEQSERYFGGALVWRSLCFPTYNEKTQAVDNKNAIIYPVFVVSSLKIHNAE